MPTIFTHALVGGAIGRCRIAGRVPGSVWLWSGVCAMLPDADVVGFSLGVPYDSLMGHRGITHSFAAAVATIPVIIVLIYLAAVRRSGALENL